MKEWIEDAWWSWKCCIHSRFVDYNDRIDVAAFWEELNYGWYQMESDYRMSDPKFDPWNLSDYYPYVMENK